MNNFQLKFSRVIIFDKNFHRHLSYKGASVCVCVLKCYNHRYSSRKTPFKSIKYLGQI